MMKLPKVFLPEKNLEKDVERFIEGKEETNPYALEDMINSWEKYFYGPDLDFEDSSGLCEDLALDLIYNLKDLENLSHKIDIMEDDGKTGIFFSALINKIIKPLDTLKLNFNEKIHSLGSYLSRGTIILESNAGDYLGDSMTGGKIIVKGNAGWDTGQSMEGGEIHIKGSVKDWIGRDMIGGEIHISGYLGLIYYNCKGKIYHKGKLL